MHILNETHTVEDSKLTTGCCGYRGYFFFLFVPFPSSHPCVCFSVSNLFLSDFLFFSYFSPFLSNYVIWKLMWIFWVSLFNPWLKHILVGAEPSRKDSRLFLLPLCFLKKFILLLWKPLLFCHYPPHRTAALKFSSIHSLETLAGWAWVTSLSSSKTMWISLMLKWSTIPIYQFNVLIKSFQLFNELQLIDFMSWVLNFWWNNFMFWNVISFIETSQTVQEKPKEIIITICMG